MGDNGDRERTLIDVERIQQALHLVETDQLSEAAQLLSPLVRGKRMVRVRRSASEPEEMDEVKTWLRQVALDPDSSSSSFLVERCYYKLHCHVPPSAGRPRGSATS